MRCGGEGNDGWRLHKFLEEEGKASQKGRAMAKQSYLGKKKRKERTKLCPSLP